MARVVWRRMVGEKRWVVEWGHEVIRVQCLEMARPWRRTRLGVGCWEVGGDVEGVRLLDGAEMLDWRWRVASWQEQGGEGCILAGIAWVYVFP